MTASQQRGAQASQSTDLAARLASAAASGIRKHHQASGVIPTRARTEQFKVTFDDGRKAIYRLTIELVKEMPR